MKELLLQTIEQLQPWLVREPFPPAFVGFDGFVDKIQKPVKSRTQDGVMYYDTIPAYTKRLAEAAGKSAQVELALQKIKLGGNAPIMANALTSLHVPTTCMGTMGTPVLHPVFKPLADRCATISLGPPAETNALEFRDGKIMLSDFSTFHHIDWKFIIQNFGRETIRDQLERARLVALVDWSNVTHATDIWKGIRKEILPQLSGNDRHYFFDLCDPSAKPSEEALDMVKTISSYTKFGTVSLGINENETTKLFSLLENTHTVRGLPQIARSIFEHMTIDFLMVHPTDRTLLVSKEGIETLPNRVVQEPSLLTGAGDNLNAGFCLGHLLGLSLRDSIIMAMGTTGAYISSGRSPNLQQLIEYLELWESEL